MPTKPRSTRSTTTSSTKTTSKPRKKRSPPEAQRRSKLVALRLNPETRHALDRAALLFGSRSTALWHLLRLTDAALNASPNTPPTQLAQQVDRAVCDTRELYAAIAHYGAITLRQLADGDIEAHTGNAQGAGPGIEEAIVGLKPEQPPTPKL